MVKGLLLLYLLDCETMGMDCLKKTEEC